MDPDVCLERILELAAEKRAFARSEDSDDLELCEQIEALDTWLSKGGLKPRRWARPYPQQDHRRRPGHLRHAERRASGPVLR